MKKLLITLVLILTSVSCMKAPDQTPNYGPEASPDDITKSLTFDSDDPRIIKQGELSYMETIQQIQSLDSTLTEQRTLNVPTKTEDATNYYVTIARTLNEFVSGALKTSTDELPYIVPKKSKSGSAGFFSKSINSLDFSPSHVQQASQGPIHPNSAMLRMNSLNRVHILNDAAPTPIKTTYHNLSVEEGTMFPPALVRIRKDCGGLTGCDMQMKYRSVSFDEVMWTSSDKGIKTKWHYTLSPDAPYLSRTIKVCAQTFVDVPITNGTANIPVTQCEEVKNFSFQDTTTSN